MSAGADERPELRPDRNLRGSVVLLVVLLLAAAGAWYVSGPGGEQTGGSTGSGSASSGDVIQQFPPGDREQVKHFTGQLLDGQTFDSADLEGGVSVFNVWGSWCGPCREEAPVLARVARETEGDGVRFVGIDVRDNLDAALAFERTYDVPYPSIVSEDSPAALLAFGGVITSAAVPVTVVVDADGAVAARVVGVVTLTTLRALVADVLAESPTASR